MSAANRSVSILAVSECWELMASVSLGRLVTVAGGQPEIFPVNFAVQRKTVVFRTGEGTKLASTAINNRVLFEADQHNETEAWSVVVKGTARSMRSHEEIADAEQAGFPAWVAAEYPHYVRVVPTSVTGRRFRFGDEA